MRTIAIAALALASALPALAHAEIVTFEFSGRVSELREQKAGKPDRRVGETNITSATTTVGDKFKGTLSYDTSATPSGTDATSASYPGALTLTFALDNGLAFAPTAADYASVTNNDPSVGSDYLSATAFAYSSSGGFGYANLFMWDNSGTAFSGTALPAQLSAESFWASDITLYWYSASGDNVRLVGDIYDIDRVSPVPEPASWGMLLAGAAVVAGALRRRAA